MKRDEEEMTETLYRRIMWTVKKIFLWNDGYDFKRMRKPGLPWPLQENATDYGKYARWGKSRWDAILEFPGQESSWHR